MGKKLRFKVGDRVICARGFAIGATGRIASRTGLARNGKPGAEWVVRLDTPKKLGSEERGEVWMHDDELEPWTVPLEARPVSVGALQHPMRGQVLRG